MNSRVVIICFVFFTIPNLVIAQEPTLLSLRSIGGSGWIQVSPYVTTTSDGGFIIGIGTSAKPGTGNIDSFCSSLSGDRSMYLKYNSDASVLEWTKCTTDGGYIYPQKDGSFVFVNSTRNVPAGWAFSIEKEDAKDSILWYKTYGGQAASARLFGAIATNDGGYVMAGETNYADSDFTTHYGSWMNDDIAVIKVDSNGNKVWSRVVGGTGENAVVAVLHAPNDGCYIVGSTSSNDYDFTCNQGAEIAIVVRLDKNGNIIWTNCVGGQDTSDAACAVESGKGGVILEGGTTSFDSSHDAYFPYYGCPEWIIEIDSDQNILWNNCYGDGYGGECYANCICKATDGSIWTAGLSTLTGGYTDTAYGKGDAWFLHIDSVGNFINSKVLGSTQEDRGYLVYPLQNGNIFAGGFYDTAGGTFSSVVTYESGFGSNAFLAIFSPVTDTSWEHFVPYNQTVFNIKSEANIFPNPTSNSLIISYPIPITSLVIFNILSQQVYNNSYSVAWVQVDVSAFPAGVYLIKINGSDVRKFVKD